MNLIQLKIKKEKRRPISPDASEYLDGVIEFLPRGDTLGDRANVHMGIVAPREQEAVRHNTDEWLELIEVIVHVEVEAVCRVCFAIAVADTNEVKLKSLSSRPLFGDFKFDFATRGYDENGVTISDKLGKKVQNAINWLHEETYFTRSVDDLLKLTVLLHREMLRPPRFPS